jgi:plastocyanin
MRTSLFFAVIGVSLLLCSGASAIIHNVAMENFVFDPPNPTVSPGDTVRWVLVSGTHSTTSNPESPKQWDSGPMSTPGETFDVYFSYEDGPGPFPYHSSTDIGIMEGTVYTPETCYATGDINNNGIMMEIADLVFLIRVFMSENPIPGNLYQADLNGDCTIDDGDLELYDCYFTYGLICFTVSFPVPTCCYPGTDIGACCLEDSCSRRSPENCLAMGGLYQGDSTFCGPDDPCDCCVGIRGNVDGDYQDEINVSDLTCLVEYMFCMIEPWFCCQPPCPEETDINGDESIDISDLTSLVDYLFIGGPPPVPCP